MVLAASFSLVIGGCCWQRVRPMVLVSNDLERGRAVDLIGEPSLRKVGLASDLTREDLEDSHLVGLVARIPPATPVELLKWKSRCWMIEPEYFIGVFDPATGRLLAVGSDGLFANATRVRAS